MREYTDTICAFAAVIGLIIAMAFMPKAHAGVAFFKYEQQSGMNKICYYDHFGSTVAITLKSYEMCPMTINV